MDRESLLEVAKWSSPRDTLLHFSLVASAWASVCDSEELWAVFMSAREFLTRPSATITDKAWYQLLHQRSGALPLIRKQEMTLFDCRQGRWRRKVKLEQSIQADEVSASTVLPDGSMLCCGGGSGPTESNWSSAYRLTNSGTVQVLQDMNMAREAHGIICFNDIIYVFGGQSDSGPQLQSGEKLLLGDVTTLQRRQWGLLPNMLAPHSHFNPVEYRSMFYLIGGFNRTSEMFNPIDEVFTPLPLVISDPQHTWCVVYQDTLVIVSGGRMHVLQDKGRNQRLMQLPSSMQDEWSRSPPVLHGDVAYRLAFNGDILETDLSTHGETRVKHPR